MAIGVFPGVQNIFPDVPVNPFFANLPPAPSALGGAVGDAAASGLTGAGEVAPTFLSQLRGLTSMGPQVGLPDVSGLGLKAIPQLAGKAVSTLGVPIAAGSALQALGHSTGYQPLQGIGAATTGLGIPAAAGLATAGGMGAGLGAGALGAGAAALGAGTAEAVLHQQGAQEGLNQVRALFGLEPLKSENFTLTNLVGPGGALSHVPLIGSEYGQPTNPYDQNGVNLDPKALGARVDALNIDPALKAQIKAQYQQTANQNFQANGGDQAKALMDTYNQFFVDQKDQNGKVTQPSQINVMVAQAQQQAAASKAQQEQQTRQTQAASAADALAQDRARAAIALQAAFAKMAPAFIPAGASQDTRDYIMGMGPAATTAAQLQTANDLYKQGLQQQAAAVTGQNQQLTALVNTLKYATPDERTKIMSQVFDQTGVNNPNSLTQ